MNRSIILLSFVTWETQNPNLENNCWRKEAILCECIAKNINIHQKKYFLKPQLFEEVWICHNEARNGSVYFACTKN